MDGRRHSVDFPISRTLVALRRVRSLRDPSTHSMSKLSSFIDTLDHWDTTHSDNLGFREIVGRESRYGLRQHDSVTVCENDATIENYNDDYDDESSCDERGEILEQNEVNGHTSGWSRLSTLESSHNAEVGGIVSRSVSPCLYPIGETPIARPAHWGPIGCTGSCQQGCGISRCWSRAKRYRELNLTNDNEDIRDGRPLLSPGGNSCTEGSRSFCEKFTPRTFSELVGQGTVAVSLLNAISRRQISSLHLFHGPRGAGKTAAATLFAAALNCLARSGSASTEPCGACRECVSLFSGRSRDFHMLDPLRMNRVGRRMWAPPVSSRFKVYVVDECHLLSGEAWAGLVEGLPRNVVFVMLTPNLDEVPCGVVSRSRVHRFRSVKERDIVGWLRKVCVREGIDFEEDALRFIANESSGSIRDAEMMLDQLSLLGNKITLSLVYEVNGVVSNDELLDLLYLALSSDASSTVKRARELMRSRVEPLQLVSQLANLIMDILAGKVPAGISDTASRKLLAANSREADTHHQLSHALKVLSQTEKQLRASKNQTTWLTVALLQLSSTQLSTPTAANPPTFAEVEFHRASSSTEDDVGTTNDRETLELVWSRAVGICTPRALRKFLLKRGKLVDIRLVHGTTIAELEFDDRDHVLKAEKRWKVIASALQLILGCNVELRINLTSIDTLTKLKGRPPYFSWFSCSRRSHLNKPAECKSNNNCNSPEMADSRDKCVSECGRELLKTIRGSDGNALTSVATGDRQGCPNAVDASKPGRQEYLKFRCWKYVVFPFRKARQLKYEPCDGYELHCEMAKSQDHHLT